MLQESQYRTLVPLSLNDAHQSHIFSLTKLTKTASEFCGKVASMHETFAHQMQSLVETYRRKTADISKRQEFKSFSTYRAWEQVLDEFEEDSKSAVELATTLRSSVAAALFHEASRKKGLFKKVFTYRDYFQNLIHKSEEALNKKHKLYTDAWMKYRAHEKDGVKDHRQALYYNSHNAYQLQLTENNARLDCTYEEIIPKILDDLEVLQRGLMESFSKYLKRFAEIQLDHQNNNSNRRLSKMMEHAATIDPSYDLNLFINSFDEDARRHNVQPKTFSPPKVTKEIKETKEIQIKDQSKLKPGLILNEFTEPVLKRRCAYTRRKITQLESADSIDDRPDKGRRRSSAAALPAGSSNSLKKSSEAISHANDLREKMCILTCLKSQMDLYSPSILERLGPISEEYADDLEELGDEEDNEVRKLRPLSFRPDRERAHKFIEQNFLKPSQCYYCKGIIVGLLKQGCRCSTCKMDVHKRCRGNVPFCNGSTPVKSLSIDESVEQDSSAGEYEAISTDSEAPERPRIPPKPSALVAQVKARRESGPLYSVYAPAVPSHSSKTEGASKSTVTDPKECVALFDFIGQEKVDLSITAGDRIKVLKETSSDWWEGQIGEKKGYFPTSYVQVIEPSDVILRCLYNFDSEEGDEMCIEVGQIIVLVTDEKNGWMVGISGDKKGAFPSSYVEVVK